MENMIDKIREQIKGFDTKDLKEAKALLEELEITA